MIICYNEKDKIHFEPLFDRRGHYRILVIIKDISMVSQTFDGDKKDADEECEILRMLSTKEILDLYNWKQFDFSIY